MLLRRFVPCLALLGLLASSHLARAAEPSVVVRVAPIDTLLADTKYLAALADQEETVKQLEGMLKSLGGGKGLGGIDPTKPIGLYGTVGPEAIDSTVVAMIPVADEKTVLDLLRRFNQKPTRGQDGLYTLKVENSPFPVYFRFANGYAYVTVRDEEAVAKNTLLGPAAVFPKGEVGTASATLRIDKLPDDIKQLALGQIDLRLADARDQGVKGDTKAQKEFAEQVFKDLSGLIKEVIRDGKDLSVRLDVDRKADDLALQVSLSGKTGSKLAANLTDLGQSGSVFAGVGGDGSAVRVLVNLALPENLRKALGPVIDETIAKSLAKEENKQRREKAKEILDTLEPTLKAGELDMVLDMQPPAGSAKHHTMVLGLKLKDGKAIEKALRDLLQDLPPGDRDKIQVDVAEVDGVKIHKVEVDKAGPGQAQEILGANPAYFAVKADAVLVGLGSNGLTALKEALAARPGKGPQMLLELRMAGMESAMSLNPKYDKAAVADAIREAFGQNKEKDRLRFQFEGGEALKVRLGLSTPVLKFFALMQKAQMKEQ